MSREDSTDGSRRRFLKATGAAALTASVAGCAGGDGTDTDTDGGGGDGTGTETPSGPLDVSSYPYGADETNIEQAKAVMEDAGYGPDNMYELDWLQYQSPSWKEMAETIRSRLEAAHIKMNINEATFASLLETTRRGNHQAFTLGWVADYPGPENFMQLVNPPNTVYGEDNPDANGARVFWSEDAHADDEVTQLMEEQFQVFKDNPEATEEARKKREEAAVKMEEGMWQEVALIPVFHSVAEYFWYDRLDFNPPGAMGSSRAKANHSVGGIEGKDTYDGTSSTVDTLDPIASGDTVSGNKIQDMFDALVNYRNGTTEVENLLAEEYEVSDDYTTYTFKLKEGVTYHNGDELTADDVVFSYERLMASPNTTNARFPKSVLGIAHETDDEGNVDIDSIGVEATGEYEVQIEIDKPFAYALSVLAYSAFSVVPEGIVDDHPDYDGDMSQQEFATNNPVGCGPLEFDTWEPGTGGRFVMQRFDDYHGQKVPFETTDLLITENTQASYNRFLNGEADLGGIMTSEYDPEKVSVEETLDAGQQVGTYGPTKNGETVNYARVPETGTYYFGFNMENVERPVRQAMAYVVNQPQLVEKVFKSRYAPAWHLQPPQIYPGGLQAYNDHYQG